MICNFDAALTALETGKLCLDRIVGFGFQKGNNTTVIATTDPGELATWTALKAATGDTKVVFTPKVGTPVLAGGEPITSDPGYADGALFVVGNNPSALTWNLVNADSDLIKSLREVAQFAEGPDGLTVFFIDYSGNIFVKTNAGKTSWEGSKVLSMSVAGLGKADKANQTMNAVSIQLEAGWDESLLRVEPSNFNGIQLLIQ